jgi:TonB-dependent receptor-like protein
MLALTSRALCVGTLATTALIACAPATSSALRESRYPSAAVPLTPTSRVIDAERIRRSGSTSALDAIRALVPGFRSIDTSPLSSSWPGTDLMARGMPRVMLDGSMIVDVELLRMVRATDILAIHVLSAPDATIRYGSSFSSGAIVVQTQASLRRL